MVTVVVQGGLHPLSIELFLLSPSRKYSLIPEYCASSPFGSLDNRSSED